MRYFLEDVARYLFQFTGGDLRKMIVVFPNQRARLFFNHFLSRLSEEPIWSPRYYTISDFIQKLSGQQIADPLTLLFRLFKVFREVTGSSESFDSFYYYCEMILADFDDIDKYHISADQLYMNLSNLKALEDYYAYMEEKQIKTLREFWDIVNTTKDSEEKQQFISIWDALHRIYIEFNKTLDAENLAYEGKAYREAVNRLRTDVEKNEFEDPIAFVGFNALNYSEELLFGHFKKQGNALFFWDYADSYVRADYHEAGYFLRKYLKKYPAPVDFTGGSDRELKQSIRTVAVPSTIAQAKVTEYCLGLFDREDLAGPLQTAVILADEGLLIPVINSLPSGIEKINISMGYPISDTPAFNLIHLLASLQRSKRIKTLSPVQFYSPDVFSLYQHEFLKSILDSSKWKEFEQQSTGQNKIFLEQDQIPAEEELSALIFRPVSHSADFVSYLRQIIEAIARHFRENENVTRHLLWHMEVLQNLHKHLYRFEMLLVGSGLEFSIPTTLSLIQKLLSGISVPFSGEPLDGLQVMGILETRTLDFKNIIILSMNEGNFPKTGHAPSFIPYTLREGFGLPTIQHQDAIFSYYFYRLLHRAEKVVLVYNTKTEGLQKGEASRYIQQLRFEYPESVTHLNMIYTMDPFPKVGIRALKNDYAFRKLAKIRDDGKKGFLSPSAINTFLSCKLKYYFRYIEEIEEPGEIIETVEADVFGSILHRAMKILYSDYEGKELGAASIRQLRNDHNLLESIIQQSFNKEYFKRPAETPVDFKGRNLIVRRVIRSYIESILEFDERSAPFTIVSLEQNYLMPLEIKEAGIKISIGGYIDRIDRKDGKTRVVDYKTGKRELVFKGVPALFVQDADHSRDAILQSMIYSWIVSRLKNYPDIQPSLFYVREIMQSDYDPRIIDASAGRLPVDDFNSYKEAFEQELHRVIKDLFDPDSDFSQTENADNCKYCPYQSICLRSPD